MRAAEEHVRATGADIFIAYIQCRYAKLFEHVGWVRIGGEVEYAGTPHQLMRPSWSKAPPAAPGNRGKERPGTETARG